MKDYSISELRELSNAYQQITEATARANGYKFIEPQQAEELAKLSPSYVSTVVWGNTSNWICSAVNRMIKFGGATFEQAASKAVQSKEAIDAFEKNPKSFGGNIDAFKTFDDLMKKYEETKGDASNYGLSQTAKHDGRARQCYSLIKNGIMSYDMTFVYEDKTWLIAYVNNLEYNRKFSAIGRWCHTGSFGDAGQYWSNYAKAPIFYILNKDTGSVLCASKVGSGEVRDQNDDYPNGFYNHNWDEYFTALGLKAPMVDGYDAIYDDYEEPDDIEPETVYDRIDPYFVEARLFAGLDSNLESDDYNPHDGNFYFRNDFSLIDPNDKSVPEWTTKYAADVDEEKFYTFKEFEQTSKDIYSLLGSRISFNANIARYIVNDAYFKYAYENNLEITSGIHHITYDKPLIEILPIETLLTIASGEDVDIGFGYRSKCELIRNGFNTLIYKYKEDWCATMVEMLGGTDRHVDLRNAEIEVSIDADEAISIARAIDEGTTGFTFEKNPDILSYDLKGKSTFMMERASCLAIQIDSALAYILHSFKTPVDMKGQMKFTLKDNKGNVHEYGDYPPRRVGDWSDL